MSPALLKKIEQWIRTDEVVKFYHTKQWKQTRNKRLQLDHYECQDCKREGKHTHATTVHHIKHVRDEPRLALDINNMETICKVHHNQEHPEKLRKNSFEKKFTNIEKW